MTTEPRIPLPEARRAARRRRAAGRRDRAARAGAGEDDGGARLPARSARARSSAGPPRSRSTACCRTVTTSCSRCASRRTASPSSSGSSTSSTREPPGLTEDEITAAAEPTDEFAWTDARTRAAPRRRRAPQARRRQGQDLGEPRRALRQARAGRDPLRRRPVHDALDGRQRRRHLDRVEVTPRPPHPPASRRSGALARERRLPFPVARVIGTTTPGSVISAARTLRNSSNSSTMSSDTERCRRRRRRNRVRPGLFRTLTMLSGGSS